MDDPKPGKNFAVSSGPVNSRRVAPQALCDDEGEVTSPIVRARLEATHARLRLGSPLSERLAPAQLIPGSAGPLSVRQVVSVIGATVSGVGLTLGLIQGAVVVIGASAFFCVALGLWLIWGARRGGRRTGMRWPLLATWLMAKTSRCLTGPWKNWWPQRLKRPLTGCLI